MTVGQQNNSGRFRFSLPALFSILIAFALLVFFPPDGTERAEWMQFIGRFHPLAVHFPIALILLAPVLELAGRNARLSYLRSAVPFVLALATAGAIVAALLGWFLARSGGYSGPLLTQHMWGGVSLAAVCWLCWILRTRADGTGAGLIYSITLASGVLLVAWTGYRGGQLSLGETHLTEHMPASLRRTLGLSDNGSTSLLIPGPNTFYGARVQPIFTARCISCHGPSKHKGDLRLDNYTSLMKGGKHGVVVKAADAQGSDLFRRITLPADHDDFMPKESKRPLSADQVKLVEMWITAGASSALPVDALKDAPASSAVPLAAGEMTFENVDAAAVQKLRENIAPAVARLQKQFPNILQYESRGSADLSLNASILGAKFGDSDLAAFAAILANVIEADFSRTSITDQSAGSISAMTHLRVLRLANTKITDQTLQKLGGLGQLESLSVFGTGVSAASLSQVARLPSLKHFYAGQTVISPSVTVPDGLKGKVVF